MFSSTESSEKLEIESSTGVAPATLTRLIAVTPTAAVITAISLFVAISSPNWLYTEEKFRNQNRTVMYGRNSSPEYLVKQTQSGLWTLCQTQVGEVSLSCTFIDYFPPAPYTPEDADSTNAIPYAVVKGSVYFLVGSLLILVAESFCISGLFLRKRKLFIFISGIIFILGGLTMLVGIIVYISKFKAEVGTKLEPRSSLAPAMFTYRYGYSFLLLVVAFLLAEISGTCAIFLFIYHHQHRWTSRQLNSTNTLSNSNGGQNPPLQRSNSNGGQYSHLQHSNSNGGQYSHLQHSNSNGGLHSFMPSSSCAHNSLYKGEYPTLEP